MRRAAALALALAATCALASACASSDAGPSAPSTTTPTTASTARTGSSTTGAPVPRAPVDRLVVRRSDAPSPPPYRRAAFSDGWDYDPTTGCNVRERVLLEESLVPAHPDDRCRPTTGRWRSAYDGVVTTDPADLEIDHRVALADAWRSGAAAWSPERRHAYANDLTDPNTLVAVTSSSNRSKGDSSPDQWLPPDQRDWCTYATAWVEVKLRWGLTVSPAEKATLVQVLSGC